MPEISVRVVMLLPFAGFQLGLAHHHQIVPVLGDPPRQCRPCLEEFFVGNGDGAFFTFTLDGQKQSGQEEKAGTTGDVLVPKLIKRVDPVYPEAARKAGIQGIVLLEATTDEQGNVVKVRVLKSVPELDQAAVDSLKQWKYEPMVIEGKAKGVVFTVTIKFALQ